MSQKTTRAEIFAVDVARDLIQLMKLEDNEDKKGAPKVFKNLKRLVAKFPPRNFSELSYYRLRRHSKTNEFSKSLLSLDMRLYFDDLVAFLHLNTCTKPNNQDFFEDFKSYLLKESFLGPYEDALKNGNKCIQTDTISVCVGRFLSFQTLKGNFFRVVYS